MGGSGGEVCLENSSGWLPTIVIHILFIMVTDDGYYMVNVKNILVGGAITILKNVSQCWCNKHLEKMMEFVNGVRMTSQI